MADSVQRVVTVGSGGDDEYACTDPLAALRPMPAPLVRPAARGLDRLVRTIEVEIIPRLVLARWAAPPAPPLAVVDGRVPAAAQVAEFTDRVLRPDGDSANAFIATLRARGASVEDLYLELLAPAARRLGDMWTEDLCDFTTVTVAVCRLQQVLRELGPAFRGEVEHGEHGRRALLAPVPGEQHSFGLFMVAEFFRRAGWDVWSGPARSTVDLTRLVRGEWFAVVGFSLSCETRVDALAATIRAVRRASRNRAVGILVGGPVFLDHPELVALVGADATATDGRQATLQARNLLALLPQR